MFIISYSDESYPQHHLWERRWVPNGNLNNLSSGFPFSDHENSDGFTLLFRRERPRNVHSFKALTIFVLIKSLFCHVLVAVAVVVCQRSLIMSKVARSKWGKPKNVLMIETDIQLSKLPFEMIVNVFVPRLLLVYRKGNLVSNIMDGNFWFDGDFYVRNLDASVELRHYQSL